MNTRQQNSSTYPLNFLMVSSSDHVTPAVGISGIVVYLSKNGASGTVAAGSVTEIDPIRMKGWYALGGTGLVADTNTIGPLILHASGTGADIVDARWDIVPWNPYNSINANVTGVVSLDLTQAVPTGNPLQSVGDALNAALAQGFGNWVITTGTTPPTLDLYERTGTTIVRRFNLDSLNPTSRT